MNIAVVAISVASDLFMVVGMSVYEGKVSITFLSCNSPWAPPIPIGNRIEAPPFLTKTYH